MKSIDIKSLLIGILGTLLVIACTGAKQLNIAQSKSSIGRYQISCGGQRSNIRCLVIDTTNAKVVGKLDHHDISENLGLIDQKVLIKD